MRKEVVFKCWIYCAVMGMFVLFESCTHSPSRWVVSVSDSTMERKIEFVKHSQVDLCTVTMTDKNAKVLERIVLPYAVYDVQTGDIDADGHADLCVGLIKKTPFDPVMRKRLFLFRIDGCRIRPLWLGSRLAYPFESFRVSTDKQGCRVATLECGTGQKWAVSEYRWRNFGLGFVKRLSENSTRADAERVFYNAN